MLPIRPMPLSLLQGRPLTGCVAPWHAAASKPCVVAHASVNGGPQEPPTTATKDPTHMSRRELIAAGSASALLLSSSGSAAADTSISSTGPVGPASCLSSLGSFLEQPLDYSRPGPLSVVHLPRLESVCVSCSDSCAGTNCLLRIDVTYPKGGLALGLRHPYPLAIISPGFLVAADAYRTYAERLASWGYTVLLYDKLETVSDALDDVTSVSALRQLITWAATDSLVKRVADASSVYLIGHSRGGKLCALAAAVDSRVAAVCLLDPVDNTIYAPLAPGYPSAVAALRNLCIHGGDNDRDTAWQLRDVPAALVPPTPAQQPLGAPVPAPDLATQGPLQQAGWPGPHPSAGGANCTAPNTTPVPVAIVGSGLSGDCAPKDANYRQFFEAAPGPTWEVELSSAGHFEFLDDVSPLQRAVCPGGSVPDATVRDVAQAVMVAWGELMVRKRPPAVMARAAAGAYPQACTHPDSPAVAQVAAGKRALGRLPGFWGGVELALGIGMNGKAADKVAPGVDRAGRGQGVGDGVAGSGREPVAVVAAAGVGGERVMTAPAVLERLVTQLKYEGQVAEVATRYKNFI